MCIRITTNYQVQSIGLTISYEGSDLLRGWGLLSITRKDITAEALLQCCIFICVTAMETGAIVTTLWSLARTKLLLSGLGGLRHRNYLLFTCFLLRFHRLLVTLITIALAPVHTVPPFEATEWSLCLLHGLQSFELCRFYHILL